MVLIAAASMEARASGRVTSKWTGHGLVARGPRNDRASVVRRRRPPFRRSFVPQASFASSLRAALKQYLTVNRIGDGAASKVVLCADEAFINTVQHAPSNVVSVAAEIHGDRLLLEVSDGGPGFDPGHLGVESLPDLTSEHGRGLFLIRQLTDRFEVLSNSRGTTLRMALALGAAPRTTWDTDDTKGGRI